MLKKLAVSLSVPLVLGLNVAVAQDEEKASPSPGDGVIKEQPENHLLSADVVGMEVRDPDDEAIGSVDSLLFDEDTKITGAVVSIGGFLGIGSKQVALSWGKFEIYQAAGVAKLNMTLEQLEEAPRFKDLSTQRSEEAARKIEQRRQQQQQQQTSQ